MADDLEAGDDVGWWDCSLCTYKNSADKFKCEICDLRRGTSTRKPRCNADTIVAQVVKQQEQIRQQTRAKPATPKSSSRSSTSGSNDNNNHAPTTSSDNQARAKKSRTSEVGGRQDLIDEEEEEEEEISDSESELEEHEPLQIKGNLIKYLPPTSTGRTGLIIDKKRFTQHSVTVNDVTITFTEFATRQNKYIRKKKKRRDHSKSRPQNNNTDSNDNNNSSNNLDNGGETSVE